LKQSRYAIPSALSIPEKAAIATSVLLPPSPSDTPAPPARSTGLTFFSGANIPWALPGTVALGSVGVDGVNKRVGAWLLDRLAVEESRVRGWAMMDFCDEEVVRLLVECNFRWRKQGEEGWV
jgi:1-phosphatidylinositol phosphodiesterase